MTEQENFHQETRETHMGVSINRGTPKSSILVGFSLVNHPLWGTPIYGNPHIQEDEESCKSSRYPWQPVVASKSPLSMIFPGATASQAPAAQGLGRQQPKAQQRWVFFAPRNGRALWAKNWEMMINPWDFGTVP